MTRFLLLLAVAFHLAACGYHLRGSNVLPATMKRVFITGLLPDDNLKPELIAALARAGAELVPATDDNTIVLNVNSDESIFNISLNRSGLAYEYDLRNNIAFDIKNGKGEVIEPTQKFRVNREQYNDQFLILGRAEEEAQLRQEIRREVAETLVNRLIYLLKQKVGE